MAYIPSLPADQQMALAKVSGAAELWAIGRYRDRPRDEAMTALHEITREPFVLGIGLGLALADVAGGHTWIQRVADLYRAAGADEATAAEHQAEELEHRSRHMRTG